jgi:hypothetical protein
MDEFRYSSSLSSDFLKLLGGEPLLINQKYAKNHIVVQGFMGLILSNYLFFEKDVNINAALLERLHVVEFLYSTNKTVNNSTNINKVLLDEEPNIIVFCNKLYFAYYNNKSVYKNQLKKNSNTKLKNKKLVELNTIPKKTFFFKYSETCK